MTGSLLVNGGKVHAITATSSPLQRYTGTLELFATDLTSWRSRDITFRVGLPKTKAGSAWIAVEGKQGETSYMDAALTNDGTGWVATVTTLTANPGTWGITQDGDWSVFWYRVTPNAQFNHRLFAALPPGNVQLPCVYDSATAAVVDPGFKGVILTDKATGNSLELKTTRASVDLDVTDPRIGTNETRITKAETDISKLDGVINALSPITVANWPTRAIDPPAIVAVDRNGASFSELKLTVRDGRPNVSGGLAYPNRAADVVIPKSAFVAETLAGWAYEAAKVPDPNSGVAGRKTFSRQYTWNGVAYWFYIQWERVKGEWRFWFQGWHSNRYNEYTSVTGVEARYAADTTAVDPGLAPIVKSIDDEVARAKAAEKVNADAIAANATSIKANADAIKALPAAPDLTPYAKKTNLAKRTTRAKVWNATLAGLTISTGQMNDNTAANQIPLEADLDAPVFAPIVPVGPATVRYTIAGLTPGQRYEFIVKEGIGLASAITFPGPVTQTNTPDWRVFKMLFTATKATEDGSYTLSGSANIHGPAVYTVPGLYVHDESLVQQQVAELKDIPAAVDLKPVADRVTALEANPASLPARNQNVTLQDNAWFSFTDDFSYQRAMPGGVYTSLYFEFSHPLDVNDVSSFTLTDFTTGFNASGFYGGTARFVTGVAMPVSGRTVTLVISRQAGNVILLNVLSGVTRGRVRNVLLNGTPADTKAPTIQTAIDGLRKDRVEITGTTAAGSTAGVGVLTTVTYTPPAGKRIFNHSIEIQAATGWWYKSTFNPGAETDYRYRESRTTTGFVMFTSPDAGVVSALNGRPYRIAITLVDA